MSAWTLKFLSREMTIEQTQLVTPVTVYTVSYIRECPHAYYYYMSFTGMNYLIISPFASLLQVHPLSIYSQITQHYNFTKSLGVICFSIFKVCLFN